MSKLKLFYQCIIYALWKKWKSVKIKTVSQCHSEVSLQRDVFNSRWYCSSRMAWTCCVQRCWGQTCTVQGQHIPTQILRAWWRDTGRKSVGERERHTEKETCGVSPILGMWGPSFKHHLIHIWITCATCGTYCRVVSIPTPWNSLESSLCIPHMGQRRANVTLWVNGGG